MRISPFACAYLYLPVYLFACLLIHQSIHPFENISIGRQFRQFSSMLVLVGRVTSATSFDPTYAAIIQNKDKPSLFRHLHFCKQMQETLDTIFRCISPKHPKGKFEYDIPLSTFAWFFFHFGWLRSLTHRSHSATHQDELTIPLEMSVIPTPKVPEMAFHRVWWPLRITIPQFFSVLQAGEQPFQWAPKWY